MERIIIKIEIEKNNNYEDFQDEIDIIAEQLKEGMTSGHNRNQDGEQYQFSLRVEKT